MSSRFIGSPAQLGARIRYLGQKALEESMQRKTIKEQRYYEGMASAYETAASMVESLIVEDVPDLVWQLGPSVITPKKED